VGNSDNSSGLKSFTEYLSFTVPERRAYLNIIPPKGREVVVAITAGKLDLGPWEQILYGEFDGRRPKRVLIKIIGE
jgi:hypothetical protein